MNSYVEKAIHKFQHPQLKQPQHSPHGWTVLSYESKFQYAQT